MASAPIVVNAAVPHIFFAKASSRVLLTATRQVSANYSIKAKLNRTDLIPPISGVGPLINLRVNSANQFFSTDKGNSHAQFRQSPDDDHLGHLSRSVLGRTRCPFRPGQDWRTDRSLVMDHRIRASAGGLPRSRAVDSVHARITATDLTIQGEHEESYRSSSGSTQGDCRQAARRGHVDNCRVSRFAAAVSPIASTFRIGQGGNPRSNPLGGAVEHHLCQSSRWPKKNMALGLVTSKLFFARLFIQGEPQSY